MSIPTHLENSAKLRAAERELEVKLKRSRSPEARKDTVKALNDARQARTEAESALHEECGVLIKAAAEHALGVAGVEEVSVRLMLSDGRVVKRRYTPAEVR